MSEKQHHLPHIYLTLLYHIPCHRLVRSCWGPESRHTDAVEWFLDNGVPLADIYDTCMEMTNNAGTKAMLKKRKGGDEL